MPRKRPLDRIDFEILDALQNDARLSNKELAARVGLAPSSCLERVRRLVRDDVLRGFHAVVDAEALGIVLQAMISVRLQVHSLRAFESFEAHLLALPEVVAVYHLSGAEDFMVHVAVRSTEHLHQLAMTQFSTREEVGHVNTALMFGLHRAAALPRYAEPSD
jgi:DNA-binding Lrp family transcriptional regulator